MIGSVRIERWQEGSSDTVLRWAQVSTSMGPAVIAVSGESIVEWWFTTWEKAQGDLCRRWPAVAWLHDPQSIEALVKGLFSKERTIDVCVTLRGTDFQYDVWKSLLTIPTGKTLSYADVASRIGKPTAVRAVANAIGKNPVSYLIPCHRVVYADGSVGHYRWGADTKQKLLLLEKN